MTATTKSQVLTLLQAFKNGEQLTARASSKHYGIDTFSQRLNDIERMGYTVSRCWITPPTGNRYMVYWITAEQFKKVA